MDACGRSPTNRHDFRETDPPKGSLRFYADAAVHLADPLPYAVRSYRSRAFRRGSMSCAGTPFDLIVCDFCSVGQHPRGALSGGDLHAQRRIGDLARQRNTKTGALGRLLYGTQYRRMLRYEPVRGTFDGVLAVRTPIATPTRLMATRSPAGDVVPTGVDTATSRPMRARRIPISCSPARWTGFPTKSDGLLRARSCRSSGRGIGDLAHRSLGAHRRLR